MKYTVRKLFAMVQFLGRILRNIYYRLLFGSFGKDTQVFGRIVCYYPQHITIGSRSTLNEGVILNATSTLEIGNDVHISTQCILNTGTLDYRHRGTERQHTSAGIVIEDGVWLASGVIINPGITIGKNSVVGAGSVVTKDIPPNVLTYGVPAEVISSLFSDESKTNE